MGSIGDNQLAALSGYSGTIQDLIRKALYIDDLGGYLGRTSLHPKSISYLWSRLER